MGLFYRIMGSESFIGATKKDVELFNRCVTARTDVCPISGEPAIKFGFSSSSSREAEILKSVYAQMEKALSADGTSHKDLTWGLNGELNPILRPITMREILMGTRNVSL